MKDTKWLIKLLLSIIFITSISAVSVSAASINLSRLPADIPRFVKTESYLLTHPVEAATISAEYTKGNKQIINQYFSDPEDQKFLTRSYDLYNTATTNILKTAAITNSPRNTERNVIPASQITASSNSKLPITQSSNSNQFTIFAFDSTSSNAVSIDPVLAYRNSSNELIVWGVMKNNSGKKLVINGIPTIELKANGRLLASGNASPFQAPMKMSPYQVKVNTGIYDGLPDKCFIKMIFEPGAYDGTADISNLDNLSCSYTLDYEPLQ